MFTQDIERNYSVKVLTFYDYGFRHVWGKRPVYKPDDFKGLKLRIPFRPLGDLIAAAGGSPLYMSWGEVIPAVQQGVLDGAELPMANIVAMKIYEIAEYCSLTRHVFAPGFFVANKTVWEDLTTEEKRIVLQAAREASEGQAKAYNDADLKAKEVLEPRGMKVNGVDTGAFVELAKEVVYPKYKEKYGSEIIDKILNTK
jgi:TRAP-type C4-dicarboxylate transport system substrate-binding protein